MRLGGGEAGLELAVDEQPPDVLERHGAHELLDVDAAVAQGAARLVGLGDLRRERDYALESRLNLSCGHSACLLDLSSNTALAARG